MSLIRARYRAVNTIMNLPRGGFIGLLDLFPNAAAAYSLRKLRAAYSGSAVRVRRSVDNAEADFNPTEITNGTLLSWVGGVNLLTYSNQFDTNWAINGTGTLTSGQSGYDGSSDAWLLSKSASSTYLSQSTSLSVINTFSVYAKAGTNTHLAIWVRNSNKGKYFDLVNGTIGSDFVGTPIDASIESVGNGWYRCSVTTNDASNNCRIYPADGDGDISGTSGSIYIQDAQLELGSTVTTYTETTDAPAGYGYVTTWYDQSGNSNDATQSTAAAQPKIVSGGSLVTENGKAAVEFDGGDNLLVWNNTTAPTLFQDMSDAISVLLVEKATAISNSSGNWFNGNTIFELRENSNVSGTGVPFSIGYSSSKFGFGVTSDYLSDSDVELSSTITSAQRLSTSFVNGDDLDVYLNSSSAINTTFTSATGDRSVGSGNSTLAIGSRSRDGGEADTSYFLGTMQEIVLYKSDQSSNRTGIETNINTFYSIYP